MSPKWNSTTNCYKTCILSREIGNPSNQDNSGWLREHFDKKKDSQEIFSSLRVKRSLNSSWPIWALGVWVEGKGEEKVWFRARRPQQQSNYTMLHFQTFLSDELLDEITLKINTSLNKQKTARNGKGLLKLVNGQSPECSAMIHYLQKICCRSTK